MDCPLLIHVGYHKTATTWLQNFIFNNSELGFTSPWGAQSGLAAKAFILKNSYRFDSEVARSEFRGLYNFGQRDGLVPVISNEALCGQPIQGGRFAYSKHVADRLHNAFPEAQILVVIREQKSSIISHYRQYVANGGMHSIESYIGDRNLPPGFAPPCPIDHFEYDLYVSYLQSIFDKENVLVLPFETLRLDRKSFVNKICFFAGLDECSELPESPPSRVGLKGYALGLRRFFNQANFGIPDWSLGRQSIQCRVAGKLSRKVNSIVPGVLNEKYESKLKKAVAERIGDRFADSNHRLAELTGLSLAELGYPLKKSG